MKSILIITFFIINLFANDCKKEYKQLKEINNYKERINGYINEYHLPCDVIYAYNLFLDKRHKITDSQMQELEKDSNYASRLGKLAEQYSYIANYIINKQSFRYFNKFSDYQKYYLNRAIKKVFRNKKKNNLLYIQLSLEFIGDNFKEKQLAKTMKKLSHKFTIKEMKSIYTFWNVYSQKYNVKQKVNKTCFIEQFYNFIKIYTPNEIKKYQEYANDFYPTLLPENYTNIKYIKTIKYLLKEIKGFDINQQAYFLKNISLDIQIALKEGKSELEIVKYFKPFIAKGFIVNFGALNCVEKQGIAMLVSDNLNLKLDWIKNDKEVFAKIKNKIKYAYNKEEIINTLGLYNYSVQIYAQMKNNQQKIIFNYLMHKDINNRDITKNLSLVYILSKYTTYMNAVINENNMYKHQKYKNIFEQSINGKNVFAMFINGKNELFAKNVDRLVTLPYSEIDNYTLDEKIEIVGNMADIASYATMLIPGAGVAMQIGKSLAKASLKGIIKQGIKKSISKTGQVLRNQLKAHWNDKVKYVSNMKTNNRINTYLLKSDKVIMATTISTKAYSYFFRDIEQKQLCTGRTK